MCQGISEIAQLLDTFYSSRFDFMKSNHLKLSSRTLINVTFCPKHPENLTWFNYDYQQQATCCYEKFSSITQHQMAVKKAQEPGGEKFIFITLNMIDFPPDRKNFGWNNYIRDEKFMNEKNNQQNNISVFFLDECQFFRIWLSSSCSPPLSVWIFTNVFARGKTRKKDK